MRKKVVSAILCASMVAGMVVIPGVAVKADDNQRPSEMESGWREHEERAGSSRLRSRPSVCI